MTRWALEHLNQSLASFPDLGYVVVPDVLSAEEAHDLYNAFDVIRLRKAGERPSTNVANERGFVRDERFVRLLTRPALIDTLRQVIGDDIQLCSLMMRRKPLRTPGGSVDGTWIPTDLPRTRRS
jgi:hypothetical protein